MRVGINLFEFIPPGARGAGVLNYMKGLIRGFADLPHDDEFWLFVNPRAAGVFLPPGRSRFREVVVSLDARMRWTRVVWEQFLLPFHARRLNLDVVHCPSGTASIPIASRCVSTVHATNMFYYREHFPSHRIGLRQYYIEAMQRWVLPRCAAIVTVSRHSKDEIVRYLDINSDVVHVVYHAPVDHNSAAEEPGASPDEPYILDVTSGAVHKNIPRLIKAYARLRMLMASAPRLLIVGWIPDSATWGMNSRQELEDCAASCGVADYVTIRPFVPDSELDQLYRHARLFVFPSMYEGFGHVVLEAMRRGVPTVVSRSASIPEVAGDAAIYVDPTDEESIARGMREGLTNERRRAELIEGGYGRLRAFGTWARVAAETREVFQLVAGRGAT